MDELAYRAALATEALEWVGTPYISNGAVKGKLGGTDCAMLLVAIYQNVGLITKDFDPRPYPPQWHVHQSEERYMNHMLSFAHPVAGPPERVPLSGDIVMFRQGRVFSHGAIVIAWPNVVHAVGNAQVCRQDLSRSTIGKLAYWTMEKRFFSFWPQAEA